MSKSTRNLKEKLKNNSIKTEAMEKVYTMCVQNQVCKYNHKFTCYWCKISVDDLTNILKHVQTDKGHQERKSTEKISNLINDFQIDAAECMEIVLNSIVVFTVKKCYCVICSSLIILEDVENHIKESKHILSQKNSTDSVEPVSLIYKCPICKLVLKTNVELKYHKMFHLSPERIACSNIDIINFSLQGDKKYVHCSICNKIISSEEELEVHVKSKAHYEWIDILQNKKVCDISDIAQHLINLDTICSSTNKITFIKSYYCQVCELDDLNLSDPKILNEHKNSKNHKKRISKFIENKKSKLTVIDDDLSLYVCFICNTEFTEEKLLYDHYNSTDHQYSAKVLHELINNKYISIPINNNALNSCLECTLCGIQGTGPIPMLQHIFGLKHINKANNKNVSKTTKKKKLNEPSLYMLPHSENKSKFYCYICKTNIEDFMVIQHLKSMYHMKLLKKNESLTSSEGTKLFLCQICNKSFSTDLQLIEHFRDDKHQDSDQANILNEDISNNSADNTNNSSESIFKFKNINQSENLVDLNGTDNVDSNKLVLDSVNQNNVLFSPKKEVKLRRPKNILNLAKIGEKYIELCIEPSTENIYNVDTNLIYKMKLGITLSLPINLENRYCIPCNKEISSNLKILYEHLQDEEHKKSIVQMVVNDNPHSSNIDDYISDFNLACSYMRKSPTENAVLCFACLVKVENSKANILDHIKSKTHIDNCQPIELASEVIFRNLLKTHQNFWYFAENFVCDVCSVRCYTEIEFAEHLTHDQHFEKESKAEINGEIFKPYMCVHCVFYWYSNVDSHSSHCNESLHKRMLESKDYALPKMMDSVKSILNDCDDTISSLLRDPSKVDRSSEREVLNLLERIIRKRYPEARAFYFGSRVSLMNFEDSDLNVYLDCDGTYKDFTSTKKSQDQLAEILECINQEEKIWTIENVNLTMKIPTIRLQHKVKNLICNIQCSNSLAVEKSVLIRFFVEAYSDCRKLILFLKKWISLCGLSGTQGITDYAISILVIFYLQTENILPSLHYLIQKHNQSNIVAGWETGYFVDRITIPKPSSEIQDYLKSFFNLYAEFNYITDVICPFLGRPVRKRDFANFDNLPKEMNVYKNLYESGNAEIFRFDSPMCVQDPIELSENVTAIVTKMQLRMFRQYCLESKKILEKGNK